MNGRDGICEVSVGVGGEGCCNEESNGVVSEVGGRGFGKVNE